MLKLLLFASAARAIHNSLANRLSTGPWPPCLWESPHLWALHYDLILGLATARGPFSLYRSRNRARSGTFFSSC